MVLSLVFSFSSYTPVLRFNTCENVRTNPSPTFINSFSSPNSSSDGSSHRSSEGGGGHSEVKSIFEGATKYDILHYLEDAKERGLTDVELDNEDPEEEEEVEDGTEKESGVVKRRMEGVIPQAPLRNSANRVSNISNSSTDSRGKSFLT